MPKRLLGAPLGSVAVSPDEAGLRSLADALDEPVFWMRAVRDADARIVDFAYGYCNRAALEVLGRPASEVLGRGLLELFPSHRTNGLFDAYVHLMETGVPLRHEFAFDENGVVGEFEIVASKVHDGYVVVGHDLSDHHRLQDVLETSQDMLSVNRVPDGTFVAVSPACQRILGYTPAELVGRAGRDLIHPEDFKAGAAARARLLAGESITFEYRMLRKGGEAVWVESTARPPERGRNTVAVVTRDVSERHEWQELLMNVALHDPVTGLPNRRMFDERLESEIARVTRTGTTLALLFIDLDEFKSINDRLGHLAGDQVLRMTADRIDRHVRAGDLAARYGGDEFVVACFDLHSPAEVLSTVERISAELARPYELAQMESISASLGIAIWRPGMTSGELLQAADQAMYAAKRRTVRMPASRQPRDVTASATPNAEPPAVD